MKSPLRIFTDEQLKNLNTFKLRQLKKEFFIPFKFDDKSIVTLNNYEIDEKTLTAIFEELESNLDLHIEINQNQALTDLFEKNSLTFLTSDKEFNSMLDLFQKHAVVEKRVLGKLNQIVSEVLNSPVLNNSMLNQLRLIKEFAAQLNSDKSDIIYKSNYELLENQFNDLNASFPNAYKNAHKVEFLADIGIHVSNERVNLFNYLPQNFKPLETNYSRWCNESIVNQAMTSLPYFKGYKKRDLKIFIEAAKIAQLHFDSPELQLKLKNAKQALKPKPPKGMTWFGGIVGILLLFRLIYSMANFSKSYDKDLFEGNRSGSNQENVDEYNKKLNELFEEYKRKNARENLPNSTGNSNSKDLENLSLKDINKKYCGEDVLLLNANRLRSNYKVDTINLNFETEIFPATFGNYAPLFPKSVEAGGKNKTAAAYITFKNSELNFSTSHLVDIFYNIDNKPPSTVYTKLENKNQSKLSLRAKRIPFSKFNLKGFIYLKDAQTGLTKSKAPFSIKYSPSKKAFDITLGDKNLSLDKKQAENIFKIPDNDKLKHKFFTIINNLGLLHNKYLKEKNYYAMNEISGYEINPGMSIETNFKKWINEKGNLRFMFASSVDNYAYCELNTKKTSLKYIFDFKSGIVKGLIRTTTSEDKSEVEQIVLINQ